MKRTLLLAAALAASSARAAEPDWYRAAVDGWSQNMRSVLEFEHVVFHDEEDIRRVAYYPASGAQRPLFAFDASPVKSRSELDGRPIALTTFRDNAVLEYYVKGFDGSRAVLIGRRDRPETTLVGSKLGYWWEDEFIRPGQDPKPFAEKQRVIVLKPKAWTEAPDSVLSEHAPDRLFCSVIGALGALHRDVGYSAGIVDILESLLPVEQELALAGIVTAEISRAAADAVVKKGAYDAVNAELAAYRRKSVQVVADLVKAGGPEDRFSPAESRFLSCRVAHVAGPDDRVKRQRAFYDAAAAAAQDPAARRRFVAGWRRWLAAELALYPAEAAAVPGLPEKPAHAASSAALEARTLEPLAGRFPAVPTAAAPEQRKSDPERTRRRVERAAARMLEELK